MQHVLQKETALQRISRESGTKPSECNCPTCQSYCQTAPGMALPEEIEALVLAGYGDRLSITEWRVGQLRGLIPFSPTVIAVDFDKDKGCTFFKKGLCELHNTGLKPIECRLATHVQGRTNYDISNSISWLVVREWLALPSDHPLKIVIKELS